MKIIYLLLISIALIFTSCYVQHPRYVTFDKVQNISIGMTYEEVNTSFQMTPNDIVSKDTLGNATYIYKYRIEDVKRIPILMKKTKGVPAEGGFRDLKLTFNSQNELIDIKGCYEEQPSVPKKEKIKVNALIASVTTIVTVTIPAIMLYIAR